MGQIVKGKKKGRPSKADLARRAAAAGPSAASEEESDVRRRLRRRNVRYNFDFDDYAEDEVYNEEEERRREKKMRVLLKLQGERAGYKSTPSKTQRASDAPSSQSDSEDGTRPLKKKKKIDTVGDVEEDDDEDVENEFGEDTEVRERKAGRRDADSVPGTPSDPLGTPLPDQKTLELILDKLQKKDTYGVYAEPVDPEELPDYHDVIEHPMDFATVRKKLGKGSYSTLEQLESDVLLICSNAMQYNAPDTIYYKQAFAIQELAKRKFQRFKSGLEHYEKELPSDEQRETPNTLANKQIKKSTTRITQEVVASDFSSGATLATLGDSHPGSTTTKARGVDRPSNVDEYVDGIATPGDNNLDKPDDLLSGRGLLGRFGRKPLINDDNRRATYDISAQPVSQAKSLFTIFDGEIKQLVAVGLHVDHSYARSLARFAAMLGPVAWNVASKRIEQALPPGFKFGRGWVGEYEPVLTPVLNTQKCLQGDVFLHRELNQDESFKPGQYVLKTTDSIHKRQSNMAGAVVDTILSSASSCPPPSKLESLRKENLEVKPTVAASISYPVQSPRAKNSQAERKVKKRVELNSPSPLANQCPHETSVENQTLNGINMQTSKSKDPLLQSMNLPASLLLKCPEDNGFVEVPNGTSPSNSFDINRTVAPTPVSNSNARGKPASYFPHGQQQGLTDPVQLMMRLTENAQKLQKPSNHSTVDNTSVPLSKKEDLSNASSAAARAWMSIGTGVPKSVSVNANDCNSQMFVNSLRSPTQVSRFRNDFPVPGMQFHPMNNNFPVQAFMAPHSQTGSEAQYQNRPQMVFPHFVTADLSRFQMRAPRHSQLLQRQPSDKQETTVPPDLNIVFQSSGSPGRQSSGVQVDPQQPDLALQL